MSLRDPSVRLRDHRDEELNRILRSMVDDINEQLRQPRGPQFHTVSRRPQDGFGDNGDTAYDAVNDRLYMRAGGAWKELTTT